MGFSLVCPWLTKSEDAPPHRRLGAVRFRLFQVQSRRSKGGLTLLFRHVRLTTSSTNHEIVPHEQVPPPSGSTSDKGAEVPT